MTRFALLWCHNVFWLLFRSFFRLFVVVHILSYSLTCIQKSSSHQDTRYAT